MKFNYPSFIGVKEQTESELLFNSVRMLVQTHIRELWADLDFGTKIRDIIKQGIDDLSLMEIRVELETKINEYFSNDIVIKNLIVQQEVDKIKVQLDYIELKTGVHYTLRSEETIISNDIQ